MSHAADAMSYALMYGQLKVEEAFRQGIRCIIVAPGNLETGTGRLLSWEGTHHLQVTLPDSVQGRITVLSCSTLLDCLRHCGFSSRWQAP